MVWSLASAAFVVGLLGAWHCVAMCSAPCAWAAGGSDTGCMGGTSGPANGHAPRSSLNRLGGWLRFTLARAASYAAVGALAAASVAWLGEMAQAAAALRPAWTLVYLGVGALGLWLLVVGRMPSGLAGLGDTAPVASLGGSSAPSSGPGKVLHWVPAGRMPKAAHRRWLLGFAWGAMPCGLLHAALLVAALAPSAAAGAAVMAAFAAGSTWGLLPGLGVAWRGGQAWRTPAAHRVLGVMLLLATGAAVMVLKLAPLDRALCVV